MTTTTLVRIPRHLAPGASDQEIQVNTFMRLTDVLLIQADISAVIFFVNGFPFFPAMPEFFFGDFQVQ